MLQVLEQKAAEEAAMVDEKLSQALPLDVSASKTCAYQYCPSGCMLRHSYTCSGCGVVTYCSKNCQKAAWETHKDLCRLYQNYKGKARFDEAA